MFDALEKLSDELCPADLIFIEIDIVGGLNPIDPEIRRVPMDAELREYVIAQIAIKRIFSGKMSEVSHELSLCIQPGGKTSVDPASLQDRLYELFDDRSFAGLQILEGDVVG